MKTLAFTGHRPSQIGGYDENNPVAIEIKNHLRQLTLQAYDAGYTKFITGMALGVDQWAGQIVSELKQIHNDIILVAAVPFVYQSNIWILSSKQAWENLLSKCDEIYIVDRDADKPIPLEELLALSKMDTQDSRFLITKKLQNRNEWIVERADTMLAVWKQILSGGTYNCIKYAQSKGKKIIVYNPDDNTISKL